LSSPEDWILVCVKTYFLYETILSFNYNNVEKKTIPTKSLEIITTKGITIIQYKCHSVMGV